MHFFCDPVFAQVTKRQLKLFGSSVHSVTCLYLSPRCQRISEGITEYSGEGGGGIRGSVVTSRVEGEAGNSHLTANEGVS